MKIYLLFFLGVNIFISCNNFEGGSCRMAKQRSKESLYGLVSKKHIEDHNHDYRNIEIKEFNGDNYLLYFGNRTHEDFYLYIVVGDTVFKEPNSLLYQVRRDNVKKDFYLSFGCPYSLNSSN